MKKKNKNYVTRDAYRRIKMAHPYYNTILLYFDVYNNDFGLKIIGRQLLFRISLQSCVDGRKYRVYTSYIYIPVRLYI